MAEPGVRPLVDAMNATGRITTGASCEGRVGRPGQAPYVYFRAATSMAADIERLLRADAVSGSPQLHAEWVVEARFDTAFHLAFTLHSPKLNALAHGLFGPVRSVLNERRMRADLSVLVKIVQHAAWLDSEARLRERVASQDHRPGSADTALRYLVEPRPGAVAPPWFVEICRNARTDGRDHAGQSDPTDGA